METATDKLSGRPSVIQFRMDVLLMSATEVKSTDARSSFSPYRLPLFGATDDELELFMLFALFVVRTNSDVANSSLRKLLIGIEQTGFGQKPESPYQFVRQMIKDNLEDEPVHTYAQRRIEFTEELLKECGCRFFKMKAAGLLHQLDEVKSGAALRKVTRDQMLRWPGVGWKTSSFFILHTQSKPERTPGGIACLDVHVLRYLKRKIGHRMDIPDQPPQKAPQYILLEREFLKLVKKAGVHPAYFDVGLWMQERLQK